MSRILDWIDRDNARTDAILASRTNTWLIGRALIGVAFAAKGIACWEYTLRTSGSTRWRRCCSPAA